MAIKISCDNCNYKLSKEHIVDEESVDRSYRDLVTDTIYQDTDDIPSGHSAEVSDMIVTTYECPRCQETTRTEDLKFIKYLE